MGSVLPPRHDSGRFRVVPEAATDAAVASAPKRATHRSLGQAAVNEVRGSVMEYHCQKGTVDFQTVTIVDEAETLKLLHEEVDP